MSLFQKKQHCNLLPLHLKAFGPPGTSGTISTCSGICLENESERVIQSQLRAAGSQMSVSSCAGLIRANPQLQGLKSALCL